MSSGSPTTIRANVDWCSLNPAPGQYDWQQLDQLYLNNPAFAGADFIYTFLNPPGWAVGQTGGCLSSATWVENLPPLESAWTSFVSALVQHANGRIKYFELWNEYDYSVFWAGSTSQMVRLAHDAATIIHGANQGLKVLSPSVSSYDGACAPFSTGCNDLESFFQSDPPSTGDIDIVGVHAYPTTSYAGRSWPEQSTYDWFANVRRIMGTYGYQNYPLWSTEGSWGLNGSFPNYGDAASQRAYVARYYLAMLSLGVGRAVWYAYSNPSWAPLWTAPSSPGGSGALTPAGIATNELEKPGGWLTGATLSAPCSHDSSTQVLWTCTITRPHGYTGRILWVQSGTRVLLRPAGYTMLRTLSGASSPLPSQLSVGIEPVLIENSAVDPVGVVNPGNPVGASRASLTGIAKGRPRLAFTLSAGNGSPALKKLQIALPKGLSFSSSFRNGTVVCGPKGKRLKGVKLKLSRSALKITLPKAASRMRITIKPPAIGASWNLISGVRHKKVRRVQLTLKPTDARGFTRLVTVTLNPS